MRNWTKRTRLLFLVLVALPGFLLFVALGGVVVRELWNALLPPLFGLPAVTFWQALGLLALCRILFGGLGHHGGSRSNIRRRIADRIADRVGERWDAMTPEERERFRQRIRERCGFDPSTSENKGQ